MSLMDWIQDIGGKLKMVQVAPASPAARSPKQDIPAKAVTRSVTLAQLMREIDNRDVRALSELPAELTVPFDEIFKAAGVITASHGWHVEKLCALLASEPYCMLQGEDLTRAVLARLESDEATAEDLARDAVGRDQAIDAFEEFARGKMQTRSEARRRKIADSRAQIARLENEIKRLEDEAVADRQEWRAWRLKKTEYEKMMAGALACLLDRPIVTLDPDDE